MDEDCMNIVLLSPTHQSSARGNTVTVDRWARGLRARGHGVTVLENHQSARIIELEPDVLHAHHAVHCGPTAIHIAERLAGTAVVVSLGGTDLHCRQPRLAPEARHSLAQADAVVGPFAEDGAKLRSLLPGSARFHVVPRGVLPRRHAVPPGLEPPLHGVVLGGIRPVKAQLDALRWQRALGRLGVAIRLSFAGPVVDEDYGRQLQAGVDATSSATWLGILEREAAAELIDEADFLLSSSLSEGASNAILEALASGRPVCARRAPGNTQMLDSAPDACAHLVDDDEAGMAALAAWLKRLGSGDIAGASAFTAARDFVTRRHHAADELDALCAAYRLAIASRSPATAHSVVAPGSS